MAEDHPQSTPPADDPARSERPRPSATQFPTDLSPLPAPAPDATLPLHEPAPPGAPPRTAAAASGFVTPPTPAGMFGRYRLDAEIARGGMGAVYRAFDTQMRRTVALKVMLDTARPEEARQRFVREGILAARLSHPNLVPVHEVGEVEGRLFFTMDLVNGESVKEVLARMKVIPPRAALKIARDCARGLHYAHEQKVIHRDVKPANLMVTQAERERPEERPLRDSTVQLAGASLSSFRALVADFGLAKDIESESRLSQSGQVMGTLLYMSPEQAQGDARRMGPATDVYSLGASLYEMLCGSPPFTGENAAWVVAQILGEDPVPLRRRVPSLHQDLETIVARAMAKDPARRYPSAQALADDIDRYLAGEVIEARPSGLVYRTWRKALRYRAAVAAAAAVLAVGAAALVWPSVRAAWQARLEAAARRERERDAHVRLEAARTALAAGRIDEVVKAAQDLADDAAAAWEHHEDVALPATHRLLAEAYDRKGDNGRARLERFRAYRAEITAPAGVESGRDLVEHQNYDEARALLAPGLHAGLPPAVQAETEYWLGRAEEGVMEFGRAVALFDGALGRAELPAGLRGPCREHRAFAAAFARRQALPFSAVMARGIDLDGDGRPEIVAISGKDVIVAGRDEAGEWRERARLPIPSAGTRPLASLCAFGLPDARRPALLVGAEEEDERHARLWFLRWDGGSLRIKSSLPTRSPRACHAWGDFDGDGRPELVLGMGFYESGLRIYDWEEKEDRLVLRGAPIGLRNDVYHLLAWEPGGAGGAPAASERRLLAFLGPWGGYGIRGIRWTIPGGRPVITDEAVLGVAVTADMVPGSAGVPGLLVGTGWRGDMSLKECARLGVPGFEQSFPVPGLYRLEPIPGGQWRRSTILATPWGDEHAGACGAFPVHAADGDFLWCPVRAPTEATPDGGVANRILVYRSADLRTPFASLLCRGDDADALVPEASWGATHTEVLHFPAAEGDRIVLNTGTRRSVVVLEPASGRAEVESAPKEGSGQRVGGVSTSPTARLLAYAGAAEELGLAAEAFDAFTKVAGEPGADPSAVEAANRGRLRCLAALGRDEEIGVDARAAAERNPGAAAGEILAEGVALLDHDCRWSEALALARYRLEAVPLGGRRRESLLQEIVVLEGLAAPARRYRLVGPAGVESCDWLASSPLCALHEDAGALSLFASAEGMERMLVPLSNVGGAWRLEGRIQVSTMDWGNNLCIGLGRRDDRSPEDYWRLGAGASGSGTAPLYSLAVAVPTLGGREGTLHRGGNPFGAPLRFDLTLVAHQRRIVATVKGLPGSAAPRTAACACEAPTEREVRAGILFGGVERAGSAGDCRLVLRVDDLEVQSASPDVVPLRIKPATAVEHLMLANGRWIAGRREEARALYDAAIALADLDRERAAAAARAQLPSAAEPESPYVYPARWAAVDARLYRGLLRAAGEDDAGAQADLDAAWALAPDRVRELLRRYALPLKTAEGGERRREVVALRAFWRRVSGRPDEDPLDLK